MRGGLSSRAIVVLFVLGAVLVISGSDGGGAGPASRTSAPTSPAATQPPAPSVTTSSPTAPPATTGQAPSPVPVPEELAEQLERTDRLERQVPLVRVLPHETPEYRIDYRAGGGGLVLVVTLTPVLNDADGLPAYRAQLAAAKRAALEFVASQGVAPGAYPVEYRPAEAAEL